MEMLEKIRREAKAIGLEWDLCPSDVTIFHPIDTTKDYMFNDLDNILNPIINAIEDYERLKNKFGDNQ